ncbi:MAG: AraC family transcriptional regulator [Clostridiaceae bacterium]|nr:AraC family transcriptional regulator [Clostridiaceae bacterium]
MQLRETAIAEYEAVPERFAAGFYDMLSRVSALTFEVRQDYKEREEHRLTREAVEGHPYQRLQIMEILGDYLRMLPDAERIGVHFDDTEYIVTSGASYTLSQYVGRLTGYRDSLEEALKNRLKDIFANDWKDSFRIVSTFSVREPRDGVFILFKPLAINAGTGLEYNAVMLYEFTEDSFEGFVGTDYSGQNCGLAIFTGTELLYCNESFDEVLPKDAEFAGFLTDEGETKYSYTENGINNSVFKTKDHALGLTFVTVFPESIILRGVNSLYSRMNLIMLCVVIGFILIAAGAVMFTYRPVKLLMEEVRPVKGLPEDGGEDYGEFPAINRTLETMRTENTQMREVVAEQKLLLMDYIFGSMLHGMTAKPSVLEQMNASFEFKRYIVAVVANAALNNAQREDIAHSLEQLTGMSVFMTDLQHEDYLILVFAGDERLEDVEDLLVQTEQKFSGLLGKVPECGFGDAVSDINALKGSYREALLRLRERRREAGGTLRERAGAEFGRFLQTVQEGRAEDIPTVLDELFFAAVESCQDMFQRRFICYEILERYLDLLKKLNIRREKSELDRLISFFSEEELRAVLAADALEVCAVMRQSAAKNDSRQREQFIEYLDRHFTDPALTLTEVADAFGMSVYTCSRVFKDLVGIGFKEYTAAKRIEYAKGLLISTNLSISEIAEGSGFSSTSYFISRFKSAYGVPPNKFRST